MGIIQRLFKKKLDTGARSHPTDVKCSNHAETGAKSAAAPHCANHPHLSSVATCHYCGRALCGKCLAPLGRTPHCQNQDDCLAYQDRSAPREAGDHQPHVNKKPIAAMEDESDSATVRIATAALLRTHGLEGIRALVSELRKVDPRIAKIAADQLPTALKRVQEGPKKKWCVLRDLAEGLSRDDMAVVTPKAAVLLSDFRTFATNMDEIIGADISVERAKRISETYKPIYHGSVKALLTDVVARVRQVRQMSVPLYENYEESLVILAELLAEDAVPALQPLMDAWPDMFAKILGRVKHEAALGLLSDLLKHPKSGVRSFAVQSLGKHAKLTKSEEAIRLLKWAAREADRDPARRMESGYYNAKFELENLGVKLA